MRLVREVAAAAVLCAGLIAGLLAPSARAQEMQFNQAQLVHRLLPSVVNILAHSTTPVPPPAAEVSSNQHAASTDSFELKSSAGSGFIVDPSGVIVTNWHVVDRAYQIFVTLSDGTRTEAKVLNAARILDIALLKVDVGYKLPAITWGDSSKVQIGDPVLAIGNPLGIGESVSAGIISALNRNIEDTPYDDFIQTDAPINHGNSGGPLFSLKGEVIGINTALISPTTANAGLGFAIPSSMAQRVIERLETYGWVRPAFLGVKLQQMTPDMALALGQPEPKGEIIAWVTEGGPAEKAGLQIGDIILRFDNVVPTDERDLLRMIAGSNPGRQVTLGIQRDGRQIDVAATLGEWPRMKWEERDAPIIGTRPHWRVPPDLGVQVSELTAKLAAQNEIPAHPGATRAVLVEGVAQDTDAARRGINVGDVILEFDRTPVATQTDWLQAIATARAAGRKWGLVLDLPKDAMESELKIRAPKWIAVRIASE